MVQQELTLDVSVEMQEDNKRANVPKFLVDYCKRGRTKCKKCRLQIPEKELRIGKTVKFKTKFIIQYFHVKCTFDSFQNARNSSNVITCVDDINDIDLITDEDRMKILQLMDEINEKRKAKASSKPKKYPKPKPIPQEASKSRLAKLKTSNLPAMNILNLLG